MNANDEPERGIHEWFELSYANYLVLPRTLLQSMPAEWQLRMVACLDELDAAFRHVPQAQVYDVIPGRERGITDLTDAELRRMGYDVDRDSAESEFEDRYYDRAGDEIESPDCYRVVWPTDDPVPHYNRGRTRIEPRTQ